MIFYIGVTSMFLRKLGKHGVAMTEYAVLLAFVAAIGGSFASDNGLSGSINDAIAKAESAINLVLGNSSTKKTRVPVCKHATEFQEALSKLVDGLYDDYSKDGNKFHKIWIDDDGTIKSLSVYDSNGNSQTVQLDGNLNVNSYLEGTGYTIGTPLSGRGSNSLAFNKEGQFMSTLVDGRWSKIFLKDSEGKVTEIGYNSKHNVFQLKDDKCGNN